MAFYDTEEQCSYQCWDKSENLAKIPVLVICLHFPNRQLLLGKYERNYSYLLTQHSYCLVSFKQMQDVGEHPGTLCGNGPVVVLLGHSIWWSNICINTHSPLSADKEVTESEPEMSAHD